MRIEIDSERINDQNRNSIKFIDDILTQKIIKLVRM